MILSYEIGKLKTDKGMFTKVLKELKLKKSEVIMVGDSVESDVAGRAVVQPVLLVLKGL